METERVDEMIVRSLNRRLEVLREIRRLVGAEAVVRTDNLAEVLDNGRDGERAGDAAPGTLPDAVGDDEEIRARTRQPFEELNILEVRLAQLHGPLERRREEVIFVDGSDVPRV
jgi:hypothetical protein